MGRGPGADVPSPVRVTSLGNQVRAIESTHTGGYAVLADGTVRAWGPGYTGQLGNGSTATSSTPVVVQNVGGGGALSGVTSVASDDGTALALRQDGSVVGWGSNLNQQIGDDTDVDYKLFPTPVLVPVTSTIVTSSPPTSKAQPGVARLRPRPGQPSP